MATKPYRKWLRVNLSPWQTDVATSAAPKAVYQAVGVSPVPSQETAQAAASSPSPAPAKSKITIPNPANPFGPGITIDNPFGNIPVLGPASQGVSDVGNFLKAVSSPNFLVRVGQFALGGLLLILGLYLIASESNAMTRLRSQASAVAPVAAAAAA